MCKKRWEFNFYFYFFFNEHLLSSLLHCLLCSFDLGLELRGRKREGKSIQLKIWKSENQYCRIWCSTLLLAGSQTWDALKRLTQLVQSSSHYSLLLFQMCTSDAAGEAWSLSSMTTLPWCPSVFFSWFCWSGARAWQGVDGSCGLTTVCADGVNGRDLIFSPWVLFKGRRLLEENATWLSREEHLCQQAGQPGKDGLKQEMMQKRNDNPQLSEDVVGQVGKQRWTRDLETSSTALKGVHIANRERPREHHYGRSFSWEISTTGCFSAPCLLTHAAQQGKRRRSVCCSYSLAGITEKWWDSPYNWSAMVDPGSLGRTDQVSFKAGKERSSGNAWSSA